MDFITCLPPSQVKAVMFLVACRLSKYAYFIAVSHPYIAISVAQHFFSNIFKQHELSKSIVSEQDAVLLSQFWQELFKLRSVSFNMWSAYHPESDG